MSTLKGRNAYKDNVVFEGGSYPHPSSDRTFGWIFQENFKGLSALPSYMTDTGCSPTFDGTKMSIGTLVAGANLVANRITYDYYQNFEEFYMEAIITTQYAAASGKFGLSMGVIKDIPGGNRSIAVYWQTDLLVNNKRTYIRAGSNADTYTTWNAVGTSGGALMTAAVGRTFKLTLEKILRDSGSFYISKMYDLSQGLYQEVSFQEVTGNQSATAYANAVSRPFIATYTGEIDILSWSFKGNDEINKNILILGDSISHGLLADSVEKIWYKEFNNCAAATGPNNQTKDVLAMISNAIAYRPKIVLLFVGSNDVATGVSQATYQANYTSIVDQLQAAGINVVCCTALPRTAQVNIYNQFNPWLITFAQKRGLKIIDFFNVAVGKGSGLLASNTALFPDGVHPSNLMHGYMRGAAKEVLNRAL